jgi:hypothetical protein
MIGGRVAAQTLETKTNSLKLSTLALPTLLHSLLSQRTNS